MMLSFIQNFNLKSRSDLKKKIFEKKVLFKHKN